MNARGGVDRWCARGRRFTAMLLLAAATLGCGKEQTQQDTALSQTLAGRLAGTWDATLTLDRRLSLSTDAASLPRQVHGTMVMLEDHGGRHGFEQMNRPTHLGVYEIDLGSLGFPPGDAGIVPALAMRSVASPPASGRDSVYMLLNPETPKHFLRMSGIVAGDSVSGLWIAESFLGGGGSFVLRRHR